MQQDLCNIIGDATCANHTEESVAFCVQTYSQIYNTSYAFWGGASTLNYTSPVRPLPHPFVPCLLTAALCQDMLPLVMPAGAAAGYFTKMFINPCKVHR